MLDANGWGFCRPSGKGKFELQDGAVAIEFRSSAADAAGTISTMALLIGETLQSLEAMLTEDRPTFLASLKEKGVDNLAERQKLANAIGKAKRLDRF